MIEPKVFETGPKARGGGMFVLTKFSAIAGREILMNYPSSALPKVGEYATNEAMMLKIMEHVGVQTEAHEQPLMLTNRMLVDNHVVSTEDLMRLEWAMLSYNFSFFTNGLLSNSLERIGSQAVKSLQKILMDLSPALSVKQAAGERPSTN